MFKLKHNVKPKLYKRSQQCSSYFPPYFLKPFLIVA